MSVYEWTKRQIEEAKDGFPPYESRYMDAFLAAIGEAGESITRSRFFEILDACRPGEDEDVDYPDYEVLEDHLLLGADFGEAWTIAEPEPLPVVTTSAKSDGVPLPDEFCRLGGTPDWIQDGRPPICKQCDADMVLLVQLKSLPYELTREHPELQAFTFGDAGNFYVFICPACGTHGTSWDCY